MGRLYCVMAANRAGSYYICGRGFGEELWVEYVMLSTELGKSVDYMGFYAFHPKTCIQTSPMVVLRRQRLRDHFIQVFGHLL